MSEFKWDGKQYVSDDGLVSVYKCDDQTWRVAYYPYADKDRNLSKEEAFKLAQERLLQLRERDMRNGD